MKQQERTTAEQERRDTVDNIIRLMTSLKVGRRECSRLEGSLENAINALRKQVPKDAKPSSIYTVPYEIVRDCGSSTSIWIEVQVVNEHDVKILNADVMA